MKHAMSGRKWNEESKMRVRGENSHRFGVTFKHKQETKDKISSIQKGVPESDEAKMKNRLARLGTKASDVTKKKMSNTHKQKAFLPGYINSFKGKTFIHTNDAKQRISTAHSKPIFQCDLAGNVTFEWNSVRAAFLNTGISQGNISQCAIGKRKSAGGFVWKYK